MLGLSKDICFFSPKVLKFGMVIVSLNNGYNATICVLFVVYQSDQVSHKVSDNLSIKVLVDTLFHLCLCLVQMTKSKLAWRHNFLMKMFTITKKIAVLYIKTWNLNSSTYHRIFLKKIVPEFFFRQNISKTKKAIKIAGTGF